MNNGSPRPESQRHTTVCAPSSNSDHPQRVTCPVPGCGRTVALTQSGYLEWHANMHGFCCDGVNLPPAKAASLQIDDAWPAGRH